VVRIVNSVPSDRITAIAADDGPRIAGKNRPNANAMRSPRGDQAGASPLRTKSVK